MRVVLSLLVGIALVGPGAGADDGWTTFEFESYNREFVNIRSNAQWKREGPIQATLTSPAHRLSIRDHSVELKAAVDGTYDARIRVNFSGDGDIVAQVGMVGAQTELEDHVIAPPQEVEVLAKIKFRRVEEGYEVETIELPATVEVEIESRMGAQIIDTCKSALSFLGVECGGIEAMFNSASVPLPKAGGTYFISNDKLSRSERRRLNRFLE